MRRLAICILALAAILPAGASAKSIHFQGQEVAVPAGWPVIRLAEQPRTCVRLDRRAVYLGSPSPSQRCPANAIGRRRAILIDPETRARAARARAKASRVPPAHISAASAFTGLGFDACTAPSRRSMSAWLDSPYRAIGIYIGGLNRGCSQPNLTASWVAEQVAAGWNLIPTYVGLQAPTSSCTSCATLSSAAAASQGSAAAEDAVAQAAAVGIGSGSPIYFDMESYSRSASATNATLTFLAAWTARLHALGYESGVYSSSASGIADLVSRLGNPTYLQPDHLWMANWNGLRSASDPYVPSYAWSDHQRIHQYRGGHDETWGGVTINIDNNYVEGGTVGTSSTSGENPKGFLDSVEALSPGQVRLTGWAFDPSDPLSTVSIRAYVGGKAGRPGAIAYELGPVAAQPRPDIATIYRAAGGTRGFDVTLATAKSGRERICAYAVDIGPGSDRALGCRTVGIPIPISIAHVGVRRNALRVAVRCEWPAGTECPGQILLRARTRVPTAGARRRTSSRVVRVGVARRQFMLTGARSRVFHVPLSSRGRELAATSPERLRAQLLVAFPDGRVGRPVVLRRPSG
jgi:glycoside hydrolase-like protein